MKRDSRISHLSGDLTGGITATILALPEAMAYGTIVFAPLGPEYIAAGVVAGLIALCFSNLCSAGCGGVRVMNNGPYSMTSLMIASAVMIIANKLPVRDVNIILGLLFFMIFLSGLFQVLFGLLKVDILVKYIPYPVTSGLLNGTAILIILSQIRPMLGIPKENSLFHFGHVQPLTLLVGIVTMLAIVFGPKLTKKIPAPFLGIGAGTVIYYVFLFSGFQDNLGPTIGAIPFTIPTPKYAIFCATILFPKPFFGVPPDLIWLAMGIAIVSSLQSLIAAVSVDNLLKSTSNTKRELIGQGLGNIVSSFFGGIVSAGSQSRAMANFSYGGRTSNSRLFSGLFALAILLFISPLLAKLPKVVLAATLVVLAFRIFDAWSFNLLSHLISKKLSVKQVVSDLFVVVLVTGTLVFIGVFEAVGTGILISILLFIFRMGKNVIHREYNGERIRSNVHRTLEEITCLEEHGHKIMVYELEGSLFFGTADKVSATIEKVLMTDVAYIIVDLRRVSDIDSTGAQILIRMMERCRDKNKHMMLSSINSIRNNDALSTSLSLLEDPCVENARSRQCYIDTIDDALGWVEDRLLAEHFGEDRYDKKLPLSGVDVLSKFSKSDLSNLTPYLVEAVYKANDVIFEQGTPGEQVYFIVQGKVQIVIELPNGMGKNRIATLCPGTVFGEMTIIDRGVHSANVVAETDITCYYLTNAALQRLNQEHPQLAQQLMIGFARELSKRVRIANRITTELKGW